MREEDKGGGRELARLGGAGDVGNRSMGMGGLKLGKAQAGWEGGEKKSAGCRLFRSIGDRDCSFFGLPQSLQGGLLSSFLYPHPFRTRRTSRARTLVVVVVPRNVGGGSP